MAEAESALDLEFVPASLDDLPEIAAILEDAQRWLQSRGISQWTRPFDREWIAPKIAAGEFIIAQLNQVPVAVARLLWSDPLFWGERDDGAALYIHSLAVRRAYAGQGIGQLFLEWAAEQAQCSGRRLLRLDCDAGNHSLCAYYERAGFTSVCSVQVGHATMMLFEKRLNP
jgi:GNAT superfamily N-acetyltransferase